MATVEVGDIRLTIEQDQHAGNPREEFDHCGVMVCFHSRYQLGDQQPSVSPMEWKEQFDAEYPSATVLPLYLFDHGGITMNTGGFSCPWDSGQVGWIYMTDEVRQREGITLMGARLMLQSEVSEYDQYLRGEVYGFRLERKLPCGHWEEVDSCWGFYGDPRESGLRDQLPDDVQPLFDKLEG